MRNIIIITSVTSLKTLLVSQVKQLWCADVGSGDISWSMQSRKNLLKCFRMLNDVHNFFTTELHSRFRTVRVEGQFYWFSQFAVSKNQSWKFDLPHVGPEHIFAVFTNKGNWMANAWKWKHSQSKSIIRIQAYQNMPVASAEDSKYLAVFSNFWQFFWVHAKTGTSKVGNVITPPVPGRPLSRFPVKCSQQTYFANLSWGILVTWPNHLSWDVSIRRRRVSTFKVLRISQLHTLSRNFSP